MERGPAASTIRELIGELNTLRQHIKRSGAPMQTQVRREMLMVRHNVLEAMDRFKVAQRDRNDLEDAFTRLSRLIEKLMLSYRHAEHHTNIRSIQENLDRECCKIQLQISEIEIPRISS